MNMIVNISAQFKRICANNFVIMLKVYEIGGGTGGW